MVKLFLLTLLAFSASMIWAQTELIPAMVD